MLVASSRPPSPTSSTMRCDLRLAKHDQRRERVVLEEGQRDVAARRLDALERRDQLGVVAGGAVDLDALVVAAPGAAT